MTTQTTNQVIETKKFSLSKVGFYEYLSYSFIASILITLVYGVVFLGSFGILLLLAAAGRGA